MTAASVPVRNLVARWQAHVELLWQEAERLASDAAAAERARRALTRTTDEVRRILERRAATPLALPEPSLQAFATLALLAEPDNHATAVEELAGLRARLAVEGPQPPARVTLHLSAMRGLWRRRTRRGHHTVRCHVAFVGAGSEFWYGLACSALDHDPERTHQLRVREEAHSERFAQRLQALLALRGEPVAAAGLGHEDTSPLVQPGRVHDLEASFVRINHVFFGGALARPRLRWSARATWRKFGHYDFVRDELVLSRSLDDPSVPLEIVDFVMYHELLHKVHGITRQGTRRIAHTPAFRRDERRYPDFEAAERFLQALSARLRPARRGRR